MTPGELAAGVTAITAEMRRMPQPSRRDPSRLQ
jgi:hypothetical protein